MPVSKKRKKEGKPARRPPAPAEGAEHARPQDAKPNPLQQRMGRPTNPFVAQQLARRGALRGR